MAVALSLIDGIVFALLVVFMVAVRYDFDVSRFNTPGIAVCAAIAFLVFLVCGPFAIYRGRYHTGSADQFAAIAGTVALGVGLMWVAEYAFASHLLIPTSVPIAAGALMIVVKSLTNWAKKNLRHRTLSWSRSARSTLVIGAGHHGVMALEMIASDPRHEFVAVGLLDNDPELRHLRHSGIRVLGPVSDLAAQVDRTGATVVIIAVPDMDPTELQSIAASLESRPVEIKVLPALSESNYPRPEVDTHDLSELRRRNFRDVTLQDLIGRTPISTDIEHIASSIAGRTVIVTGAGGSIGSQLCRQVARFNPKRLVMTDRDESGLHATQLGLEGSALLTSEDLVLGNLRDTAFVQNLVAEVKPDIIFHAAALKHLTFLERFPEQAVRTNVGASLDLLDAAVANDVPSFVHISTDKAAGATSVLGRTKFSIERAIATVAANTGHNYMSVRFGNVLGSRGSVLETFVAQVAAGDPVTVTHPEVSRYFMTADEACELVLQAAAIGSPGETLVLDMGEPIRIADLARRVIALSGRTDAQIVYTGLRPGEKLDEVLLSPGEVDVRPNHPLITQVPIVPVDLAALRGLVEESRSAEVYTDRTKLERDLVDIVDVTVEQVAHVQALHAEILEAEAPEAPGAPDALEPMEPGDPRP